MLVVINSDASISSRDRDRDDDIAQALRKLATRVFHDAKEVQFK